MDFALFVAAVALILMVTFGFLNMSKKPDLEKAHVSGEVVQTTLAQNKYLIAGSLKIKTASGEVVKGEYQGLASKDANVLNIKPGDRVKVYGYKYADFVITEIA